MHPRDEFVGLEFDWLAVDADGCVALFSSAGCGPVPDSVFTHFDGQQAIDEQLCRLARVAPTVALQQQSLAFAARGIYVYDWTDTAGLYRRYSTFARPAKLLELGFHTDLQTAFVVLPMIHFASAAELRAADLPTSTDAAPRGA